jgi:diguanylate cyclase (GGDEF)-like protein
MTTNIALAAVALGGISLVLFVLAIRRLLTRQSEVVISQTAVVAAMLDRYDDRLASFAQSLNDTLTTLPARYGSKLDIGDDPEPVMRALELAVAQTTADGAVALVTGGGGSSVVATIGLSEAETNHIARMGFPDYRGARAIEIAFAGDIDAPEGSGAIRSGLVVPLLGTEQPHSLLSVLTRDATRRFSEEDVAALDDLVTRTRPAITKSLNLREPDVVPELDLLTSLYDRQSFEAVLGREIAKARVAYQPLFLLIVDVDRLTTLNAKIGRLAADGVLLAIADRLRAHVDRLDYTFRLVGGRFAVVRRGGTARDAHELFGNLQSLIGNQPLGEAGFVSVSAGVAELLPHDDAGSLAERAEDALIEAKRQRRGSIANEG